MTAGAQKALVIKLGALGDVFLMLGGIEDVSNHVNGKVDVLTTRAYAKIFQKSPFVDRVFIDERKSKFNIKYLYQLRKQLNSAHYDLVVDFQNSNRTLFYRKWLLPKSKWCQSGTVSPDEFKSNNTSSRELAKFEFQLESYGINTKNLLNPSLEWLADDQGLSFDELRGPLIILLPGSSKKHSYKIWPHYAELAKNLLSHGFDVFVVPGPEDMDLCQSLPGKLMLSKEGKWLNFFQLASLLLHADFVVGNDSGPTHLAASLKVKGLALFGSKTAKYSNNMKRNAMDVWVSKSIADIHPKDVTHLILSNVQK